LTHTHQQLNTDTDFVIETIDNANEGISYSFQHNLQLKDTTSIDLGQQDFKTLKVQRDYWGIFEKVISKAQIKNHQFSKVALVGASQSQTDRLALYVQDNNKPLVIVGNTKIQGLAYLPERGVK